MARRTFFALLAIFSWFFAIFLGWRRFVRWVMTVFWSCGGSRGAGELFGVAVVFRWSRRGFSLRSLRVSARAREELLPRRPHLRRPRGRGFRTFQPEVAPTQRLWIPAVSRRGHLRQWPGCRVRLEFQRGHNGVTRSFPSASVMTGGPAGPSTQCAHDRPALPDPVGHADHGQNAVWKGRP